jgi:hypothetical protein
MAAQTGPTAHTSPLYPLYLAFLMRLGGNELRYGFLMILSLIFAHSLQASLLPAVSEVFFGNRLPEIYGAVMIIFPAFEAILAREAIYVAIGLMTFCVLAQNVVQSRLNNVLQGAILGLFTGVLIMLNPVSLLFCTPWTAYLLVTRRLAKVGFGIAFVVSLVLACLPWTIRNHRELGGRIFVRSNLPLELYVANNACAEASLSKNMLNGCHSATHPNVNVREALALQEMCELSYIHEKLSAALRWIRANPRRFWSLTVQRTFLFWFPYRDVFSPASGYSVCLITFVALLGFFGLLRDGKKIALFILAVSLLCSGPYSFFQADLCYRYPILWLSVLCAGCFAARSIHPRLELQYKRLRSLSHTRANSVSAE